MQPFRPGRRLRARPSRLAAAWLGLLALFLQNLVPLAHAAAMVAAMGAAEPGTFVICTATGPQKVRIAEDGRAVPADPDSKLPPACPGCQGGLHAAALPPPQAPGLILPEPAAAPAGPADPAAAPGSPRYPPAQPRGPPPTV